MMRSDSSSEIFENYANLISHPELIKKAEEKPKTRTDPSAMQLLYGLNPSGDEKDLLDQAHPDPVIYAPSYDKLNGLIENLKERQNIMIGIVHKPPQSRLTSSKYAAPIQNLSDELIRLGFQMDNANENELRILADQCAERIQKQAWIPLAIGAVAAGLGLIYMIQNHAYTAQGIRNDCQKTIDALNNLLAVSPEYETKIKDYSDAVVFIQQLNDSIEQARVALPTLDKIDHPETIAKAVELAHNSNGSNGMKLVRKWGDVIRQFTKDSLDFMNLLKTIKPKQELTYDWLARAKKLWHQFSPGEVEEVFRSLIGRTSALEPGEKIEDGLLGELQNSIKEMDESQKAMERYVANNKSKIVERLQGIIEGNPVQEPKSPIVPEKKSLVDKLKGELV